jgi:hypothetical protein
MSQEAVVPAPERAREDLAVERDDRADRQLACVETTRPCSSAAPISKPSST